MNDELDIGMPGGRGDYNDGVDESDAHDAITTASWQRQAETELASCDLGTSDDEGYEGEDGDYVGAYEDEEASHSHYGSLQNAEE